MEPSILRETFAICGIALVLEALAGYPAALFIRIGHPVTWMGAALAAADRYFNRVQDCDTVRRRNGALVLAALVVGCALAGWIVQEAILAVAPPALAILAVALLATPCLAQRSLDDHVGAVAAALDDGGVAAGRSAVARIVGRDVDALDAAGIARAAIESLAENFSDGIVAPAFWLALLGLPGAVAYKAINTADSMIGHRTPRHAAFGFAAAKLDDAVNWPAARLAALALVVAAAATPGASVREAWRVLRRDARGHSSPNAGWPEAAMAGALGLRLGGARIYGGARVEAVAIGDGTPDADAATIRRALRLYRVACGLQIAVVAALAAFIAR